VSTNTPTPIPPQSDEAKPPNWLDELEQYISDLIASYDLEVVDQDGSHLCPI